MRAVLAFPVRVLRGSGRAMHGGLTRGARGLGRVRDAHGAGESGLSRLIDLTAASSAGDALIAIALAGSLFFAVPLAEARERVALYLLMTLVPFAVLSPVIGPLLDSLRAGRRYALAATFIIRAVLAGLLAEELAHTSTAQSALTLYPVAFGLLISSKAYALLRAAVVPRLLPPTLPLVPANSRVALAALGSAFVAAGVGAGVSLGGPAWPARLAAVLFLVGIVLAAGLPQRVDVDDPVLAAADGDRTLTHQSDLEATLEHATIVEATWRRSFLQAPGTGRVRAALRANIGLRAFTGFLLFYLAFLLREAPLSGLNAVTALGIVLAALGFGGMAGTVVAGHLRLRRAELIALGGLVTLTLCVTLGALVYGLIVVAAVAFVAGAVQSMSRLCLDALTQQDIPESARARAFARSETILQLSWVAGGAIGMFLPGPGGLGLGVAAAGLVVGCVVAGRTYVRSAGAH